MLHPIIEEDKLFVNELGQLSREECRDPKLANLSESEKDIFKLGWKVESPQSIADIWQSLGSKFNLDKVSYSCFRLNK